MWLSVSLEVSLSSATHAQVRAGRWEEGVVDKSFQ